MSICNDNTTPALLKRLGFTEVSPMQGGVYHLRNLPVDNAASTEYIVLLYSPVPISQETSSLQLFMQAVPSPMPPSLSALQIQIHWQKLDARRFEESGLCPATIDLPVDDNQWGLPQTLEYARPEEPWRIRYCVQLQTGEVVCYN